MKYDIVESHENVVMVPSNNSLILQQRASVYTNDGTYIPLSKQRTCFPVYAQLPYIAPTQHLEREGIYGGPYITSHIGHFTLETLARLWFAKQNPHLPVIWNVSTPSSVPSYHEEILSLLGIKNEFIFLNEVTSIKKIHIPLALYDHLPYRFYDSAYNNVYDCTHNMPFNNSFGYFTRDFLSFLAVYRGKKKRTGKKIFISRSAISDSGYINEAEIEQYAIEHGYTIFIPEKYTIQERLDEISSAEEILMIEASSFFPLLLLKDFTGKLLIIPRMCAESFTTSLYLHENKNMHFLDIKQTIVASYSKLTCLLYKLDINDLDIAIKNARYKEKVYCYDSIETVFKKQHTTSVQRFEFFDLLDSITYTSDASQKLFLFKKALSSFFAYQKTTHSSQAIIEVFCQKISSATCAGLYHHTIEDIREILNNWELSVSNSVIYMALLSKLKDYCSFAEMERYTNTLYDYTIQHKTSFMENHIFPIYRFLIVFFAKTIQTEKCAQIISEIEKISMLTCNRYKLFKLPLNSLLYYTRHNFSEALALIHAGFQFKKDWAEGYHNLSITYNKMNKQDLAILNAYKAITLEETYTNYKGHLISMLLQRQSYQEITNIIENTDDNKWKKYQYAKMYNSQKNFSKAIENQKEAVKLYGGALYHKKYLSELLYKNKDFEEAKQLNHEWMELEPGWSEPHIQLANIYEAEGNLDKALACAQKAVVVEPYNLANKHTLAEYLRKKKKYVEIEKIMNEVIAFNPYWSESYIHLALNAEATGNLDKAIDYAKIAVEKEPYELIRKKQLATWYKKKKQYTKAKQALQAGVTLNPYWAEGFIELSLLADLENNHDEAIQNLFLALKANAYDFNLYKRLLDRLIQEKLFLEAHKVLTEISLLNPWWYVAHTYKKYFDMIKKNILTSIETSKTMIFNTL